jgi:hypothetical protein
MLTGVQAEVGFQQDWTMGRVNIQQRQKKVTIIELWLVW